ncbi:endolytic transglycosylase MltG [Streptomyces tricolor]|nr:endolytic transglycosylase MltG [Streptomyces tricolor]
MPCAADPVTSTASTPSRTAGRARLLRHRGRLPAAGATPGRRREPEPQAGDGAGEENTPSSRGAAARTRGARAAEPARAARQEQEARQGPPSSAPAAPAWWSSWCSGGGLGGVGYFGYKFYQNRFAPAPDYAGEGTSETVSVEIPKGAGGWEIGRRLEQAGVVKAPRHSCTPSRPHRAPTASGRCLPPEEGDVRRQRRPADAGPAQPEQCGGHPGERNSGVYAAIDKKLELSSGTTKKIADKQYKNLWPAGLGSE